MTVSENRGDSAGVAINKSRVSLDGDLVGRDKVLNQYYVGPDPAVSANGNATPRHPPSLLPYLPDRREQQRQISNILQKKFGPGSNKLAAFFVFGVEDDCLESFVQQIFRDRLPKILEQNGLALGVQFRPLKWPGIDRLQDTTADGVAELLDHMKGEMHEAIGLPPTASKAAMEQKLVSNQASHLLHVSLDVGQWRGAHATLIREWLKWIIEFDLQGAQCPIVVLLTVSYRESLFGQLMSQRLLAAARRDIRAMSGEAVIGACVHELPSLGRVRFDDMEHWIREYVETADPEVLRRVVRRRFSTIFGFGVRSLSMYRAAEAAREALFDPSIQKRQG